MTCQAASCLTRQNRAGTIGRVHCFDTHVLWQTNVFGCQQGLGWFIAPVKSCLELFSLQIWYYPFRSTDTLHLCFVQPNLKLGSLAEASFQDGKCIRHTESALGPKGMIEVIDSSSFSVPRFYSERESYMVKNCSICLYLGQDSNAIPQGQCDPICVLQSSLRSWNPHHIGGKIFWSGFQLCLPELASVCSQENAFEKTCSQWPFCGCPSHRYSACHVLHAMEDTASAICTYIDKLLPGCREDCSASQDWAREHRALAACWVHISGLLTVWLSEASYHIQIQNSWSKLPSQGV